MKNIFFGLFISLWCHAVLGQNLLNVSEITIIGNKKTKSSIILRELKFKQNDQISATDLDHEIIKSKQNLINTNLFVSVEITKKTNENNVYLSINVTERWYLVVLPQVFLSDRNINEWWYDRNHDLRRLTYGVAGRHANLTGNNDNLNLKAFFGFIPYFEASYSRPYIDKRQRLGIKVGVFYSTQNSMPYKTFNDKLLFFPSEKRVRTREGIFTELRFRNGFYHFHNFYVGFSHQVVADTITKLNPYYFGYGQNFQKLLSLNYSYRYDRRDNRQYALTGHVFQGMLTDNIIFGSRNANQFSLFAMYGIYHKLSKRLYGEYSIRGKYTAPKFPYYSLMNNLGYENNVVRGYELFVIDGQANLLLKSTLKYELFKGVFDNSKYITRTEFQKMPLRIYPNVFLDGGSARNYYPSLSNTQLANKILVGGGFGLDFVTWYDLNFKINYSFNQLKQKRFFFALTHTF